MHIFCLFYIRRIRFELLRKLTMSSLPRSRILILIRNSFELSLRICFMDHAPRDNASRMEDVRKNTRNNLLKRRYGAKMDIPCVEDGIMEELLRSEDMYMIIAG